MGVRPGGRVQRRARGLLTKATSRTRSPTPALRNMQQAKWSLEAGSVHGSPGPCGEPRSSAPGASIGTGRTARRVAAACATCAPRSPTRADVAASEPRDGVPASGTTGASVRACSRGTANAVADMQQASTPTSKVRHTARTERRAGRSEPATNGRPTDPLCTAARSDTRTHVPSRWRAARFTTVTDERGRGRDVPGRLRVRRAKVTP